METRLKNGKTQQDYDDYVKREREYTKMTEERSKRGRELFARYFHSLWD